MDYNSRNGRSKIDILSIWNIVVRYEYMAMLTLENLLGKYIIQNI